jgi:zinc transporter, ZIP family
MQSDSAVPRASAWDEGNLGTVSKSHGRPSAMAALRRPSMTKVRNRVVSFVKDTKSNCDQFGPCYGYSDPCGQECFKHIGSRSSITQRMPHFQRTSTTSHPHVVYPTTVFGTVREDEESVSQTSGVSPSYRTSRAASRDSCAGSSTNGDAQHPPHDPLDHEEMDRAANGHGHSHGNDGASRGTSIMSADKESHHHHVPTNAFMAIGLQTVIAIALHKLPEGFITYATNHANPALGLNVFMALFVHNVAEGFAMALPLYMALGSRATAIAWSSVLGGLSQPLGAGLAALWFHFAGRDGGFAVDNVAYACLFAVTAGIMTSVALQLFVESLSLNHNRNLSIAFAFLGMTLLGVSNALVK